MFQIPDDDDDEFLNEIPLDISHHSQSTTSGTGKENRPQLRIPHAISVGNPSKRLCTEFDRDNLPASKESSNTIVCTQLGTDSRNVTSSVSASTSVSKSAVLSTSLGLNYEQSDVKQPEMRISVDDPIIRDNCMSAKQKETNTDTGNSACLAVGKDLVRTNKIDRVRVRSGDSEMNDYVTPKRRRKFPGPAGILPQLGPGKSLDAISPSILNKTSPTVSRSGEDDSIVASSQTSDDVFNDSSWQALLSDLNEDGQKLLKKFSIISTLYKAGKKQLHHGKAGLIFGIIESVESHGSEASVSIRDKSGRMQGTIHKELLTEFETELQAGTVLVLKQVSIISLSNRNHYLNITPNNIVALYYVRQNTLKSRMFHGSQDSLSSVLSALEKKADDHQNRLNSSLSTTPTGSAHQSPGGSNCSTPHLLRTSPNVPVHQGTPVAMTTQQSRLSSTPSLMRQQNITPVRDVSLTSGANRQTLNHSYNLHHNGSVPGGNTVLTNSCINPAYSGTTMSGASYNSAAEGNKIPCKNQTSNLNMRPDTYQKQVSTSSAGSFQTCQNVSKCSDRLSVPQTQNKWKFKSPPSRSNSVPSSPNMSTVSQNQNVPKPLNNTNSFNSGGNRVCQLSMTNKTNKVVPSTSVSSVGVAYNKSGIVDEVSTDNLWEDDLSDEILSQMSEDFT